MDTTKQQRAIAEALGYHDFWEGFAKFKDEHRRGPVPDYLGDLNAMHEAEKTIDGELYTAQLLAVIHEVDADYFNRLSWDNGYELATATAAQRAEAFLKTRELWKD